MKLYSLSGLLFFVSIHENFASTGVMARPKGVESSASHHRPSDTNDDNDPAAASQEELSSDMAPLLEAFEKEIYFMTRDFGQDLRQLVDKMKASVGDESDPGSSPGPTRTKRRRSRRSKSHIEKPPKEEVVSRSSSDGLEDLTNGAGRFKNLFPNEGAPAVQEAMSAKEASKDESLELKNNDEFDRAIPETYPTTASPPSVEQTLENDWNMIDQLDMPKPNDKTLTEADSIFSLTSDVLSDAKTAEEDAQEELDDPLRKNLVKKAISLPFSQGGIDIDMPDVATDTSIFLLQIPEPQLSQSKPQLSARPLQIMPPPPPLPAKAAAAPRNPLWTVDQDGSGAEANKTDHQSSS